MGKRWRTALCGLLWVAAAASVAVEGVLIWLLAEGMGYLEKFGWEENPYVAEDVSTVGILAVFQLVPLLLLICLALFHTHRLRQRRKTDEDQTIDNP